MFNLKNVKIVEPSPFIAFASWLIRKIYENVVVNAFRSNKDQRCILLYPDQFFAICNSLRSELNHLEVNTGMFMEWDFPLVSVICKNEILKIYYEQG